MPSLFECGGTDGFSSGHPAVNGLPMSRFDVYVISHKALFQLRP